LKRDTEQGGRWGEKRDKKKVMMRDMRKEAGSGQKGTGRGMTRNRNWTRGRKNRHTRRDS